MTWTMSNAGLMALWAATNPSATVLPKRSFVYITTTRLGDTLAARKISVMYRTALRVNVPLDGKMR